MGNESTCRSRRITNRTHRMGDGEMKTTGQFLTTDEIESIKRTMKTPLIAIHTGMPRSPQQRVHDYALAKGLPEIPGYYGASLKSGEIFEV